MDPAGPLLFLSTAAASIALTTLSRKKKTENAEQLGGRTSRKCISLPQVQQDSPLHNANTKDLIVVTRIHGSEANKIANPEAVEKFVASVAKYAAKIVICVGNIGESMDHSRKIIDCAEYVAELTDHLNRKFKRSTFEKVCLLPVHPWGDFTTALNASLSVAVKDNFSYICYQSLEFRLLKHSVDCVKSLFDYDSDLLVAGPAMAGHEFSEGFQYLRGRTCPWNTFAIWRVKYLTIFGFPIVGDGMGTKFGGVEEVTAVAVAQHMFPKLRAVLLQVPGIEWDTHFEDKKRLDYHNAKMESKNSRPRMQLEALGLVDCGSVEHIKMKKN